MSAAPEHRQHAPREAGARRGRDPRTLPSDLPQGWLLTLQRHRRYGRSWDADGERTTSKMLNDLAALRELRRLSATPPPRA